MTLDDDVIDEFSRHILVPELGPAGQARLLETHVVLLGDDASLVHELLERNGLRVVEECGDVAMFLGVAPDSDAPRPSVVCWEADGVLHATTLRSRPCPACVTLPPTRLPPSSLGLQALALLGTQALALQIVAPSSRSTDLRLHLASGQLETEDLAGNGCALCLGAASGAS